MKYKVSVIMPALNEEGNITAAIEDVAAAFKKYSLSGEIIVINDGSTDDTVDRVRALSTRYSFLKLKSNQTPGGIGSAFWKGVKTSEGEIVLLIPGDGEVLSADVLRYVSLLDHVDVLVPFVYNREVRSLGRQILSKLYKAIINLSFGLLLNYMNGSVIYRRCVLEDIELHSPGFFYQTELLIKTITRGYLFAEVPCAIKPRKAGFSTALKPKSFVTVIQGYLSMMFAVHVLHSKKIPLHRSSVTFQRRQMLEEAKTQRLRSVS